MSAAKNPQREIGQRLAEFRGMLHLSQPVFAACLDIKRERLSSYESGRVPFPWEIYLRLWKTFHVNPRWLALGDVNPVARFIVRDPSQLPIAPHAPFLSAFASEPRLAQLVSHPAEPISRAEVRRLLKSSKEILRRLILADPAERRAIESEPWFQEGISELGALLAALVSSGHEESGEMVAPLFEAGIETEISLDDSPQSADKHPMAKTEWRKLSKELAERTGRYGQKSRLAEKLGVSRQAINQWIAGTVPRGEQLLKLMDWLQEQRKNN